MNQAFDEIVDRRGTASMKWGKYKDSDILPMWVADMDFKAPQPVIDALSKRVDHGVFGYTMVPDSLNRTIAAHLASRYNWQVTTESIVWIPGVVCGLNIACAAIGDPGDRIVTATPIYPPFLAAPGNVGKTLVKVPMKEENSRSSLDFEALEKEFQNRRTRLFMYCSPQNPCGTVFTQDETERLVRLCKDNDVVICSDEIHCDFVLDEKRSHTPTASVSSEAAARTITLMAPSKTYNIPGLGCSFAVIPDPELRDRFKNRMKGLVPSVNLLGLLAAEVAYTECNDWLERLILYLRQNRDQVLERVNHMKGCLLNPIESTYLAWIDVRKTGLDDPVGFFENAGVGLSDGLFFDRKGFVRLNFGCPAAVLDQGLSRMEKALSSLK